MRHAIAHLAAGSWPETDQVATVTLEFDERHRRRVRLTDDSGEPFMLDLERAALLADGDGLALEGGGTIRVRAADEAVLDVRGADPAHTARLAWHVGNRHTPLEVLDERTLRILDDHVLEDMLVGLGAEVVSRAASFSPEPGAYAHSHDPAPSNGHHHAHGHGNGHGHDHHHPHLRPVRWAGGRG